MEQPVKTTETEQAVDLHGLLESAAQGLHHAVDEATARLEVSEVGTVTTIGYGVVMAGGLTGASDQEKVMLAGDVPGLILDLDEHESGIILLGSGEHIEAGTDVYRTGSVLSVPVGDALIGRVVDSLGRPLDGKGRIGADEYLPIERPAPGIMQRLPVTEPLQTGIKAIDSMIPIGRGQRELILGDRQTGKTAVAVDTILNQKGGDVICIYCAIGKRGSAVARVIDDLNARGALDYSLVVVSTMDKPAGLQFIAPYAATSIAEHFMARGRDVLLVYDDLTYHARSYREICLLLRRPPGREAFPGDIFYIHSRLLERSTHLREQYGGGSLTTLPIVETEAQNISGYIPTNLISITDGQVYLSPELFRKGILPAVDVGKSVSRVGGKTQLKAYRGIVADLKLSYSQFEELETFARFGTRLDEETRKSLERGKRIREVLKQPQYSPMTVAQQLTVLLAANEGLFDSVELDDVQAAESRVRKALMNRSKDFLDRVESDEDLDEEIRLELMDLARNAIESVD